MTTHMPPGSLSLESQLLSIMDVLVKAAVTEISQLFSESSSSLRLHLTQSLKENEALRMRMKVMRSELFSLRLQTRTNRPVSRFSPARGNIPKTRAKSHVVINPPVAQKTVGEAASVSLQSENQTSSSANQVKCTDVEPPDVILIKDEEDIGGCGPVVVVIKPPVAQKTVGEAASICLPSENKTSSLTTRAKCADVETSDVIQIKDEDDVEGCGRVGQDDFENQSARGGVDTETPLSCPTGNHEELRIVSVHGRGEGPLQETSDTLFTASELQAFSSLSPDHNVTHDSLLNFTTGANDKSMLRGMQDNSVALARNSKLERNHSAQMASAALNPAIKKAVMGADGHLMHPSNVSQFPQQQNIFPHAVNKSLDCSFCGERFLSREDLIVHRATHTGESPIPCSFCGKSFVNKTTLTIHMRIHTGEKPYACDQCGKRFTQNGSLKIHLRTHSGEKPYTCNQCTASFNNPSNLRRHMITHNT